MKIELNKGDKFGKLTVISEGDKFIQPSKQTQRGIICKCECGNIKTIRLSQLVRLRIKSCGCINEKIIFHNKRLYGSWRSMVNRCHGEKTIQPQYYKSKGITVCDEWRYSYNTFAAWALKNGWNERLTIDRVDGNLGYYPANCRFVTQKQNNLNRCNTFHVTYNGIKQPLMEILININKENIYNRVVSRLRYGWSAEKAIDTPVKKGNYIGNKKKNTVKAIIC